MNELQRIWKEVAMIFHGIYFEGLAKPMKKPYYDLLWIEITRISGRKLDIKNRFQHFSNWLETCKHVWETHMDKEKSFMVKKIVWAVSIIMACKPER